MVLFQNLPGGIRKKTRETSVTTAGVTAETRTEFHPNMYADVAVTPACLGLSETGSEDVDWVLLALIGSSGSFLNIEVNLRVP
jgi:hypothetical protein